MKRYHAIFLLILAVIVNTACSSLQPEEPTSGDFDISSAPVEISFEADVNTTQYRAIEFSNTSDSTQLIDNMALVGNDCGAFSVFNVMNETDDVLYQPGEELAVAVAKGSKVKVHVRFSPTPCEVKSYVTTLIIYFKENELTKSRSINLNATVNDTTVTLVCPEKEEVYYNDEIGDPTPSRKLPALANGEYYYLKVERMRAFIQPTAGFSSLATKVGTDIGVDLIAEEDIFQPVYLPFVSDGAGNLTLMQVDDCAGFAIPSPVTDTYFWGASSILTTPGELSGTVEIMDPQNIGEITFKDFQVRLFANINNGASLIQNEEGNFAVNIITDLTSAHSESNAFLADITDETDDDGDPLLNFVADGENSYLYGSNLYHGTATFVGVGRFEGTDAQLSGEASSALIENEAYIFIQIDAKIVTRKTE